MRRERHKIRIKPKKRRKMWLISPRTRIHGELEYKRSKLKEEAKRLIEEESGEQEG
ncbi:MAG: hypothetical protein QMD08_00695 [Actinomycetota bacterium]|nr:hypothetical protein [Actinomycetota bacterium]